ncbi:hypothetical protein [Pontixanthobacter sp. CEM42]|uniref:hypothetical protein n=1 Tax=Pontixanthobacter sp. CEM42 TaxID=2792077 RepID=UPI001ADF1E7E|nr:hypothetical protein [Pontixanthobacter sp. CEM42]
MSDPTVDENVAKTRFLIISLTRVFGVFALMLGILVVLGKVDWPPIVGYVLLVVGVADFLIIPQFLTKKWRSNPE